MAEAVEYDPEDDDAEFDPDDDSAEETQWFWVWGLSTVSAGPSESLFCFTCP
jgi:hypothetical protein